MNNKIDYIVKHDRFPLSKVDKISIGIIFSILIGLAIGALLMVDSILSKLLIPIILGFICFAVYNGYISSMVFKKIPTGFDEEQNRMLVVYCLGALNIKPFRDQEYNNVFVCFVHDQQSPNRQEIYIVAKDKYVLIHSNKEKEGDAPPGTVDFVDRIGGTIYRTARQYSPKVIKR